MQKCTDYKSRKRRTGATWTPFWDPHPPTDTGAAVGPSWGGERGVERLLQEGPHAERRGRGGGARAYLIRELLLVLTHLPLGRNPNHHKGDCEPVRARRETMLHNFVPSPCIPSHFLPSCFPHPGAEVRCVLSVFISTGLWVSLQSSLKCKVRSQCHC